MKKTLVLVAALAATIGAAAAQTGSNSGTAGGHTGGATSAANGNNNVSSGNSSNTSSSAANNNPTTATPNYKPAVSPKGTGTKTKKPANPAASSKQVIVSSGGQGHNSGPAPKGKIVVAPSATTKQ